MNIANNIEAWLLIDGYDNYEISSFGRVRNNITSKIVNPKSKNDTYYNIDLSKNGLSKKYKIHRLVAEAFCEKQEGCNIVDHIDRNKKNNHFTNLRWTTQSINIKNGDIRKNNASGSRGVSFDNNKNKWVAQWSVDKKRKSKRFSNKEDAIEHRKLMESIHDYN